MESLGIAAFSAQLLRGLAALKSVVNGNSPWGIENLLQILPKQVAQCQISLMIQAAGNDCPITQNTDLIPQSVAEDPLISLIGR